MKKYRSKLDEVMAVQGRTSIWLADLLGVSGQSVSNWRAGDMPRDEHKSKIAELLGTTVGALFFGEGVNHGGKQKPA